MEKCCPIGGVAKQASENLVAPRAAILFFGLKYKYMIPFFYAKFCLKISIKSCGYLGVQGLV
jgi:hypothetical protein